LTTVRGLRVTDRDDQRSAIIELRENKGLRVLLTFEMQSTLELGVITQAVERSIPILEGLVRVSGGIQW